ncbi:MAG: winged helix-turn-helix transcriptional regulator, partial [Thermoplasmatota archaeon]
PLALTPVATESAWVAIGIPTNSALGETHPVTLIGRAAGTDIVHTIRLTVATVGAPFGSTSSTESGLASPSSAPFDPASPGRIAGAAGVVAVGAGVIYFAGSPVARRRVWWLAAGLYTRLSRPQLLDHPERERLHAAIERQPGIHFHALQRELNWNTGALTYHLRVLERHKLVSSRRDGILRRFYVAGAAPKVDPLAPVGVAAPLQPLGAVTPGGLRGNVLATVRERGAIPQAMLIEELGASKQTVNYHVKGLERLGLIRVEHVGRETILYPIQPESTAARG